jgi:hypothetical protein
MAATNNKKKKSNSDYMRRPSNVSSVNEGTVEEADQQKESSPVLSPKLD